MPSWLKMQAMIMLVFMWAIRPLYHLTARVNALKDNIITHHITTEQKKFKSTGGGGTVDWSVGTADGGRLPQRAILLILAMQLSLAKIPLLMLRWFSFHLRFSRSSIRITRCCSTSRRWASSSCCRICSRFALACCWQRTITTSIINTPRQHGSLTCPTLVATYV